MSSESAKHQQKEEETLTTIWDSTDSPELQQHPLLQLVFRLLKQNLDGCLSSSYRDVDTEDATDHKQVLLTLPGKFGIDDLRPDVYATTRAGVGILFNKALVESSTGYVSKITGLRMGSKALQKLLGDENILTYIAILQEALEHELGHLKYHCEGVRSENKGKTDFRCPEFEKTTPEKLRHEAGVTVQQRIREDNFDEDVGRADCKVLKLNSPRKDNSHFMIPLLRPVFEYLTERPVDRHDQFELRGDESDEEGAGDERSLDDDVASVTKKELLEHMEYPSNLVRPCSKKRKRDNSDIDFSGSPPDDSGPSKKDGGGEQPPPSSGRNCGSWLGSVEAFLPAAVRTARSVTNKFNQKKMAPFETDFEGDDHLANRPAKNSLFKPQDQRRCQYKITFCDEERNSKTEFDPSDHIYVRLLVTNPTQDVISIGTPIGKNFGCSLVIRIDGLKPGRIDFVRLRWKVLQPGSSYTFFREFTALERKESVAYHTPPPGQYTARVWVTDQSIQDSQADFSVVCKVPLTEFE